MENKNKIANGINKMTSNNRCTARTEVFSRVVGFFRPVKEWNLGQRERFEDMGSHPKGYFNIKIGGGYGKQNSRLLPLGRVGENQAIIGSGDTCSGGRAGSNGAQDQ